MKYTLIAFKPEKVYNDRGDSECHPAKLSRYDNLTREEAINEIFQLSKDPQYEEGKLWLYCDEPFEEFHIFECKEENEETQEELDDIYWIKDEAYKLAENFNKESKIKQKERWAKEAEIKAAKELEKKRLEYEKLKLEFESKQ